MYWDKTLLFLSISWNSFAPKRHLFILNLVHKPKIVHYQLR
jgi:hypothetical protein